MFFLYGIRTLRLTSNAWASMACPKKIAPSIARNAGNADARLIGIVILSATSLHTHAASRSPSSVSVVQSARMCTPLSRLFSNRISRSPWTCRKISWMPSCKEKPSRPSRRRPNLFHAAVLMNVPSLVLSGHGTNGSASWSPVCGSGYSSESPMCRSHMPCPCGTPCAAHGKRSNTRFRPFETSAFSTV